MKNVLLLIAALTITIAASANAAAAAQAAPVWADRVLVIKSQRQLYLIRNDEVVASYPVALGRSPVGHKVFEGDGRSPQRMPGAGSTDRSAFPIPARRITPRRANGASGRAAS